MGGMEERGNGLDRRAWMGEDGVEMCLRVGLLRMLLLVEGVIMADIVVIRAGAMALLCE